MSGLDELVIPDVPEPIVGYRVWYVCPSSCPGQGTGPYRSALKRGESLDGRLFRTVTLRSITQDFHWGTGPVQMNHMELFCAKQEYMLGIHAWKTLEQGREYAERLRMWPNVLIMGEVYLWGQVMPYTHGYLATNAQVKRLIPVAYSGYHDNAYYTQEVAKKMGIPIMGAPS